MLYFIHSIRKKRVPSFSLLMVLEPGKVRVRDLSCFQF